MHNFLSLTNAVIVIVLLYGAAVLMRKRGILKEDHSLILARIVTDLCLPAMIFVTLARQVVYLKQLEPSLLMLAVEIFCIAVAWIVAAVLKFNRGQQGAVVFCSAFGSSAFLGYAVILQMFPDRPEALTEAVLISEIGVGYPIFILGPVLAAYFGTDKQASGKSWSASLGFFKSPIFFALIAGVLWGALGLPGEKHRYLAPLFQFCHVLAGAVTPIAVLTVGLMFKMPHLRKIMLALGIVVLLKLLLQPLLAGLFAKILGFTALWQEVLVVLAAMPSAILGAVFLRRYGGDAAMASALLLAASVVSCVTILGVFWFIG